MEKILYFEPYAVVESNVDAMPVGTLLTEEKYRQNREEYPGQFQVGIGAEAIRELLAMQDLVALSVQLREEMRRPVHKTKRKSWQTTLCY